MTDNQSPPAPPSVTQADREAATAYWRISRIGNAGTQRRYLSGEADQSFIVQAFARHRATAEAAVRQEMETRFWSIVDPNGVPSDMWDALDRLARAYRSATAEAASAARVAEAWPTAFITAFNEHSDALGKPP